MMFPKAKTMILCGMLMTVSSAAFAETVYMTERGKKYHKEETCRFLKNREVQKIDDKKAKELGLVPCGRCYKSEEKQPLKK